MKSEPSIPPACQVEYSMKRYRYFLTALLLTSCAQPVSDLYSQKPGYYSYLIGPVGADQPTLAANADVYITPASCEKIITALLAYKQLGPEFRYQTDLYLTADQQEAIIRFSGDPLLTSGELAALLRHLPPSVTHLWLDNGLFRTPPLSPNIMRDDVGSFYAQPVSAMNIDRNSFHVTIEAGKEGAKATAVSELAYDIISDITTRSEPTAVTFRWEQGKLRASGHINSTEGKRQFTVAPEVLEPYLQLRLQPLMPDVNLHFTQTPYPLPAGVQKIASIRSKPLKEFLPPALKHSDNMVFDSLYLTMVNQLQPGITQWEQGDKAIKQLLLTHYGLTMGNALIVDGSGLSRYNRLQPRQLYALLQKAYDMPGFREALATPGEAGSTLKKRHLPATVRAKTGSMSGIACICGYTITAAPQAFTLITAGFAPPLSEVYATQDAFLREVLRGDE